MAKIEKKFGLIEPLDREIMKLWLAEKGVCKVAVLENEHHVVLMQRVALINKVYFGVKKRFQKVPKK